MNPISPIKVVASADPNADYGEAIRYHFRRLSFMPDPDDKEIVARCELALKLLGEVGRYIPPFELADALSLSTLTRVANEPPIHGESRLAAVISYLLATNPEVCHFEDFVDGVELGMQLAAEVLEEQSSRG